MRYLAIGLIVGLSLAACGEKTQEELKKEKSYSFVISNVKVEGESLSGEQMPIDKASAETAIRTTKARK